MPWKLDEAGNVISENGLPIFIHPDGKTFGFDGDGTVATIGRLKDENRIHRERGDSSEGKLKEYEGIDPVKAREAMGIVSNLDAKKLIDAGEVDKVRAETLKAAEEKYKPYVDKVSQLEQQFHAEKIGGAFSRSKLISEKFAIPADMVQARFGSAFGLEDGKVVAKDGNGNKLYSRSRPGELADFDEALEMLVDQYPYKDHILKGSGASGGGARGSNGAGGGKSISRAQFDQLGPQEQREAIKSGTKITD